MMGYIWVGMLVLSVCAALAEGRLGVLTGAAMEGASSAVALCLSLAGALCLWSAFAKVMEKAGLTEKLGRLMQPLFRRLFPQASRDPVALGCLTGNVSANLLGLGNAATPMGIAAVRRMKALSGGAEASDEMCLLIVMNTASIQLLPTTVATVRASLGAQAPFDILPAVWLTSILSVAAGIAAAKLLRRVTRRA